MKTNQDDSWKVSEGFFGPWLKWLGQACPLTNHVPPKAPVEGGVEHPPSRTNSA